MKRQRLTALALALVLAGAAGCSSDPPLPGAENACSARERLIAELERPGPDLFALHRHRLADTLQRRAEIVDEIVASTRGALKDDYRFEADVRAEVRSRMLEGWGVENEERLNREAESAGYPTVRDYLLREPVVVRRRPFGSEAFQAVVTRNDLRLAVLCRAVQPLDAARLGPDRPLPSSVVPSTSASDGS